ncbi:hypothetical protein AXE80_09640 [Wenyingzhuangia fucanilytica]|uniref:Uncharacterized protein n=1 Tax=Wenyingzhuangia fucanilytica TaxID=1790137 RepID=A0A1B1Y6W4_9FLAO|nr:hypothetical protein [Wenyingzhuangia fucanilytica]ANW96522.1 hypothetical protein AXE80_09640 [Wenyingzhuangia fucanilytica]
MFIRYGKNGIVPVLNINVKDIIATSKNYVQFANIPESKKHLIAKLAPDNCWLKSINAGYEVYTGNSILKIDKFKIIP